MLISPLQSHIKKTGTFTASLHLPTHIHIAEGEMPPDRAEPTNGSQEADYGGQKV